MIWAPIEHRTPRTLWRRNHRYECQSNTALPEPYDIRITDMRVNRPLFHQNLKIQESSTWAPIGPCPTRTLPHIFYSLNSIKIQLAASYPFMIASCLKKFLFPFSIPYTKHKEKRRADKTLLFPTIITKREEWKKMDSREPTVLRFLVAEKETWNKNGIRTRDGFTFPWWIGFKVRRSYEGKRKADFCWGKGAKEHTRF